MNVKTSGMNVIVTGGRGRSGRWVVDALAADHDVVVLDRSLPSNGGHPDVEYRALDLTKAGGTFDAITAIDPDAVIHWAAIPVAGTHPGVDVYRNNTLAAHNVLTAAGRVGADVVQASSDGTYGFFFAEETPVPDAIPVTEDHALRPEDAYGLSKVVTEEIAETVARRDDVSIASIRPTWIQEPGAYACREPEYVTDRSAGAGNYWSYVDVRDVVDLVVVALAGVTAQASEPEPSDGVERVEESDVAGADDDGTPAAIAGHEAFNCAAPDNALGEPLRELLRDHYGRLPADCSVEGDASAYATAKADRLLGWNPTRSWRDAADEAVAPPEV
ncbi:NAD(P)-dependent oxidoreductase [Halopenitus sp. POP-27]|uniref:NAD-dependent epimerase/dehydratase family protein n=1 Tax=Halopenitus sp. POP-27 TaxID=2994425 RepID=UPI00246956BF|nr:NAD(P)-dependent oxidoreductase [Halopenitus sp. POP-27]